MFRVIETLRLYALLLTAPVTFIWARAMGWPEGQLLIATHACLIVFALLYSAAEDVRNAHNPRLCLASDREDFDRGLLEFGPKILGIVLALLLVVLFFVDTSMALLLIVGAVAATHDARTNIRRKNILIEIAAPALLLAGPSALLYVRGSIGDAAFGASLLSAVMLGLVILLCLVRDREQDEAIHAQTTATRAGGLGSMIVVAIWALVATALASIGASAEWWGAWPTLVVSWTLIISIAALASKRAGWATGVAILGSSVLAVLLFAALG